ncbi:MAG: radical SAM protein [Bacteroidales bacterium]|nr:radical SAM protein [Bacteroidales bacterium]
MYRINEIFYSLQGEGANTGTPAVFIRFSGCNLRCPFCDTDFEDYRPMSVADILDAIAPYPSRFAVLTGGEPSLQVDTLLVEVLHSRGYRIAVETNGTHLLPPGIDWVTLSPKSDATLAIHEADELKVVYTGQNVEHYYQSIKVRHYFLQPCSQTVDGSRTDNAPAVIDYCLRHPHWRLSLQVHKLLNIQ